MSQKTKADFAITDKLTDAAGGKEAGVKEPALEHDSAAAKQAPPNDAMVRQILERQAVFGF